VRPGRRARVESLEHRVLLAVVDDLRVSEIMYHPAEPPPGGAFEGKDFEFVELINTGAAPISLSGVSFVDGIDFNFDGGDVTELAPGARVLVVSNLAAFTTRYGAGLPVAGEFGRSLSNSADTVELFHKTAGLIQTVSYDDAWHLNSDGPGFSLVMLDPAVDASLWSHPASWRASLFDGGSPGAAEPGLQPGDVVINEILSHTDAAGGDWIELHNTAARAVNIADWFISDNESELNRFRIGADRFIRAGGYVVFTEDDDFGSSGNPLASRTFGFSELGESAHLTSWDYDGVAAGYRRSVDFGAADREVPFGRYTRSDASTVFVSMQSGTPGAANSPPLVGPVIINEIMYHPTGGEDGEFVELFNPTDQPVPLFDPLNPQNTWALHDGDGNEFTFPAGVTIESGGYALVVGTDPAAFRAARGILADVPVLGPYSGGLSNAGEAVELYRPGDPELDLTVPMYLVDRVQYDDQPPWPTAPDGDGPSLVRIANDAFGDDVANWSVSRQIGGTPGAANAPLPGDTNGDGRVDVDDLNAVRNHFGQAGPGIPGDTNGDGRVDIDDLNAVRNHFGADGGALEQSGATVGLSSSASIAAENTAGQASNGIPFDDQPLFQQPPAPRPAVRLRLSAARFRDVAAWDQALSELTADFAQNRQHDLQPGHF